MITSSRALSAKNLNAYYERLAFDLNDGDGGRFLSGWQCDNPYASSLLAAVRHQSENVDYRQYRYFDEDEKLSTRILDLHLSLDGTRPQRVLCGSGSTSLLYAFATYVKRLGISTVHYIPPIYFTLATAFNTYGIRSVAVSRTQPFQKAFSLALPKRRRCVLLLTDPIWYTGTRYCKEAIEDIARWQKQTSSLVFVDGSLQYLPWDGIRRELTSALDPEHTFRLVCPCKQLSIHGYRFSYLLLPSAHERGMAWTYANVAGPAPADSIAFAREAITACADGQLSAHLVRDVVSRHKWLRERRLIESVISPDCGYFVFERVTHALPPGYSVMDARYFGLRGYAGYMKINLLSPSITLLCTEAHADGLRK